MMKLCTGSVEDTMRRWQLVIDDTGSVVGIHAFIKPAREARGPEGRRACALRALGLLLVDGTPTVGRGKTF